MTHTKFIFISVANIAMALSVVPTSEAQANMPPACNGPNGTMIPCPSDPGPEEFVYDLGGKNNPSGVVSPPANPNQINPSVAPEVSPPVAAAAPIRSCAGDYSKSRGDKTSGFEINIPSVDSSGNFEGKLVYLYPRSGSITNPISGTCSEGKISFSYRKCALWSNAIGGKHCLRHRTSALSGTYDNSGHISVSDPSQNPAETYENY